MNLNINMKEIEIAVLNKHLRYDRKTGDLIRLIGRNRGKVAGWKQAIGYIVLQVEGVQLYAHRVAWALEHGEWPQAMLDHKDGDKSNNRPDNLREATYSLNNHNRAGWSKSGFKGVSKDRKWFRAQIGGGVGGKPEYLGTFATAEEAHAAYLKAAATRFAA